MTALKKHIEQMTARLSKIANGEQVLIDALSDALSRADQKLLDDVRNVSIEHETRRVLILTELQDLAARIGAFPGSDDTIKVIDDAALDLPFYAPDEEPVEVEQTTQGADWREAAENIREDISSHQTNGFARAS